MMVLEQMSSEEVYPVLYRLPYPKPEKGEKVVSNRVPDVGKTH